MDFGSARRLAGAQHTRTRYIPPTEGQRMWLYIVLGIEALVIGALLLLYPAVK